MELITNLKSQMGQNQVGAVGINSNYSYPVVWGNGLKAGELAFIKVVFIKVVFTKVVLTKLLPVKVMAVKVWQQILAPFCEKMNKLHALGNACLHKGIKLSGKLVTNPTLLVRYHHPNPASFLEAILSLYLMRLPVVRQEIYSFSLLFLKISLPKWLFPQTQIKFAQGKFASFICNFSFKEYLDQYLDRHIEMVQSKQRTYLKNSHRCYVEINPAMITQQRAIANQYEKFMQQSKQLSDSTNGNYQKPSPPKEALA